MRIGISVAQCGALARPAAVVAAVRAAEQLGYSSVWVCDSVLDPAGVLAATTAITSRVRLGAVLQLKAGADPAALARSLATVDMLSEGRLSVALGVAPGVPEDVLDPVLDVLAADRYPLLLDGCTPAAIDRIARRATGWSPAGLPVDDLAPVWAEVRRLAAAHGRDPEDLQLVVRTRTVLTPTPAGAGRPSFEGDAEQVAADVHAAHEIGAHEVVLRLGGDLTLDEALDGYARIAEATEFRASSRVETQGAYGHRRRPA